ncbi:MAG: hypothetical protein PHY46_04635, partial [Candidatus Omnitrophica bacterium]|nr:hypothetical protein [Candidatus Omnitrophota bacterium]
MAIKAILTECSELFWLDVVKSLEKKHGWEICYWTAGAGVAEAIKKEFPNTAFHYNMDAIRGIGSPDCAQFT